MKQIRKTTARRRVTHERRNKTPTVSQTLPDGGLLEMLHDAEDESTSFALWKDGEYRTIPEYELKDGRILVPYSPRNNLLAHGVVLIPQSPSEYGTDAELVGAIQAFIHRYVDVSESFERLAAYYVLFTWLADSFNEVPYLRVRGDPGTGKTRFLLTIGSLCYKPIFASGASTVSPLFRILDAMRGTLIVDESDFRLSDEKAEVVKILNNGNVRGFPVLRTEVVPGSREFNPRAYHVFGPKLVASRGPFDDPALESRFLTEEMGRTSMRADVPINLPRAHAQEALRLRNQLLLFRFRNLNKPRNLEDAVDRSLEPRLNQIFAPLLSVVDDPATVADLRALAGSYHREIVAERGFSIEAAVLETILDTWSTSGGTVAIKEISARLAARHEGVYSNMTPKRVGWIVRRKLGIATAKSNGVYVIDPTQRRELERLARRHGVLNEVANEHSEAA